MILFLLMISGVAGSLICSFLASGGETTFYQASPTRLRYLSEKGDKHARNALRFKSNLPQLVTDLLLVNNIVGFAGSWILTSYLAGLRWSAAEWWTTLILTPLFFIFGEMIPKRLACEKADQWILKSVRTVRVAQIILYPLAKLCDSLASILRTIIGKRMGKVTDLRADLLAHFSAGAEAEILSKEQLALSRSIMRLSQYNAKDMMQPIADVPQIPVSMTRTEAARHLVEIRRPAAILIGEDGKPTGEEATLRTLWIYRADVKDENAPIPKESRRRTAKFRDTTDFSKMLSIFKRQRVRFALVENRHKRIIGVMSSEALLKKALTIR